MGISNAALFCVLLCIFANAATSKDQTDDDVVVLTVATEETDGYRRYLRSAEVYGARPRALGLGARWAGGDMTREGGGQKVNLLRAALQAETGDRIVLFTDSYDVMFLGDLDEIVRRFKELNDTRVLFSAEQFCWPDERLQTVYPKLEGKGNPFLNSGGFIGYLPEVLELVSHTAIKNEDDDQLYYTKLYLDEALREKLKIRLDHQSVIFQNLNGALYEVDLYINDTVTYPYVRNTVYNTNPLILHGNGPSKAVFNSLSGYLAKAWSPTLGCQICKDIHVVLNDEKLPKVLMTLFIELPTPFIEEYFKKVAALNYPKESIHVLLRNNVPFHEKDVEVFAKRYSKEYASFKDIKPTDSLDEASARDLALDLCAIKKCDFLFVVDSVAHLDNMDTLRHLLAYDLPMVAPLIARPGKAWTNFWGALTPEGYYARSVDYMEITQLIRRGIWNVPFVSSCYLIKSADVLQKYTRKQLTYKAKDLDADMTFCAFLRQLGVFMHVANEKDYGHLIDTETFDTTLTNPDLYQIFENKWDWEQRYLHPDYAENFNVAKKPKQPCPDVYWFPMTTLRFCKEFIAIMEAYGKWSDGSNSDKRLDGGYEAVPTRDIHANQVGLERHWLHILQQYVRPLQEMVFVGYFHDPPRSLMNFVVRYKPDEQPSLRPHHDSSTYTINLALNTPGKDYDGGGCHFLRYNCSVLDTKPGWILMHPGRLTHYHEGLRVTRGVRYIMVSFVDP